MCNVLHAYQFSLKHRPGKDNQLAGAFSRVPLPATEDDYDKYRLIESGDVEFFCLSEWCHTESIVTSELVEQVGSISPSVDESQFAFCCQPLSSEVK